MRATFLLSLIARTRASGRRVIAALFVASDGPYVGYPDVDAWTAERDARKYSGPWPVVAHPPCERWGRYWSGGPSARVRRTLGDDDGCFESALASVRKWTGVIEHPEASHAFRVFNLGIPPRQGGWVRSADGLGWISCVEQGHYGHPARKATWLYTIRCGKPRDLEWGPSRGDRLDEGFHSSAERNAARAAGQKPIKRLSKKECLHTPYQFAEMLLFIAEGDDE